MASAAGPSPQAGVVKSAMSHQSMVARGDRTLEEPADGHALRRYRRISGKRVRLETGGHVFGIHREPTSFSPSVSSPQAPPRPPSRDTPRLFANSDSLDTLTKEV
jgi:hypothetical protein